MPLKDLEKVTLRTIRPSVADSSASASNPSQSASESTSSDPRLKHRTDKGRDQGPLLSKRRRVPVNITRNACVNCKKARAKCDGNTPCSRCTTRAETSPCVYEVHIKHAKEELMKQINELSAKNRLSERIFKTLQSSDKAPDILRALNNGESIESIAESLGRPAIEEQDGLSPIGSPSSVVGGSEYEPGAQIMSGFSWTTVTHGSTTLDHLFQLYFAWVHPVSTLFSEGHFVDSYRQRQRHCSSPLVNAMCALACHYHTQSEDSELDSDQLGVHFSEAFLAGFEPDDKSITTIQAAAVMFLVELGRGFGLRASSYLRLATESIAELSGSTNDELPSVLKKTIQGIRSLNVEWAQVTFQFPTTLRFRDVENTRDEEASLDKSAWYFYRHEEDQCPAWPSLLATTNREKVKLISIINNVNMMICSPLSTTIKARQVLEQYGKFVAWRVALPSSLGDAETSTQALPHVLSLLILYDYSIVQLLCPLLELEGFPSSHVDEVVWSHAQHALLLLERHYHLHFTCRYQPALQMFVVLNICHLIARFFPVKPTNHPSAKDGSEAVTIGIEVLHESNTGFPAAGALQELLMRSAAACSLKLPQSLDYLLTPQGNVRTAHSYNDFIDVCTRPSYRQSLWGVREKFDSNFAEEWFSQSPEFGFRLPQPGQQSLRELQSEPNRGVPSLMQIRNLLNTN
ncbi:hypothetical protein V502_11034 [Pseudogymnoascus sp. VKM F-4520 (FW-2644)]|nr:hypothetical protein V502_11034 [Pseudogymnoascus sp. VKM F-4520 (FW-2644)]